MNDDPLVGKHALSSDGPPPGGDAMDAPESPTAVATATAPDLPIEEQPDSTADDPEVPIEPRDQVTCPECGTVGVVALTRRDATDFCQKCDYPLFWTPARIMLGTDQVSEDSLRRLPGTGGRVTVGSIPCPHCSEANTLTAQVCVRCGGLMNPPPPPEPEPEPEPEPVVELPPPPPPEPSPSTPWWVWVVGAATVLLLIALMTYLVAGLD